MSRCPNKINVTRAKGWDYVSVELPCGSTTPSGHPGYCGTCRDKHKARGYEPGYCKHGTNMRPEDGRDVMCPGCEAGD